MAPITIDLATDDTLNLTAGAFGLTVVNAETDQRQFGARQLHDGNTTGSTTVNAGLGADAITASAGQDNFRFTSVAEISSSAGAQPTPSPISDAGSDKFVFSASASPARPHRVCPTQQLCRQWPGFGSLQDYALARPPADRRSTRRIETASIWRSPLTNLTDQLHNPTSW